jgi:TRAP-type C4-dicarboxylate transport system permease small subunit
MSANNLSAKPNLYTRTETPSNSTKETTVFKVPIGRLGLLASLLLGGASGFIVFLFTFFFAIIGVVIYDSATGTSMLNLDISYRYIAAPVGILAMILSLTYLLSLWARRKLAGRQ